ncbi:hypothetical protein JL722_12781 [Aureococcus anophagefferens]|nr:hypothetical protein JL722_12781 [Aureococcus anophagefferens]
MATMKEVIAAKGATVRDGVELDSASAGWSAPFGAVVEVLEEASTASGVARCRVGHGGRAGWVSAKVLRAPTASGESTAARLKAAADELNRAERWPEAVDMSGAAIAADPNNHALQQRALPPPALRRLRAGGRRRRGPRRRRALRRPRAGRARYRRLGAFQRLAVAALRARVAADFDAADADRDDDADGGVDVAYVRAARRSPATAAAVDRHRRALERTCRAGLALDRGCAELRDWLQELRDADGFADASLTRTTRPSPTTAKAAHKAKGAELFAAAKWAKAAAAFTKALAADATDGVLYSNRPRAAAAPRSSASAATRPPRRVPRRPRGDGRRDAGDGRALEELLEKCAVETREPPAVRRHMHRLRREQRDRKKLNLGGSGGASGSPTSAAA